jgi:hypothetical protein
MERLGYFAILKKPSGDKEEASGNVFVTELE